jgi:RND family efflux transporter MFP subunit
MKRSIIGLVVVAAVGAGAAAYYMRDGEAVEGAAANRPSGNNGRGGAGGPGGPGGGFGGPGGFGGGPRMPMTVDLSTVKRGDVSMQIQVRLGDRVSEGQPIAKIEDRELQEQLKQAEAAHAVAEATIRQRVADLKLAEVNRDRNSNLYERQLISRQTYDDTEARYQAAEAQVDLARAQLLAAKSRLDELQINMSNTTITSPVNGFVASRVLDPGAWVTPNTAFLSLVDISRVRLIANVIEKDLRRIQLGLESQVEVDAYPGEKFSGRVLHMAPILDPATRTAQIEIEIPNSSFRLKPGMYAKVTFTVDKRDNTLVVPANAVVDFGGKRGVFVPSEGNLATFRAIEQGVTTAELVEVASGLTEGEKIITTGAGALREGDRIVLPGEKPQNAGGGRSGGRRGGAPGSGQGGGAPGAAPGGTAPPKPPPPEGAPIRPSTGD